MENAVITFPILGDWFQFSAPRYFTVLGLRFHWYGLIIAVGLILAVIYALRTKNRFGLTDDNILDLLLFAIPIAIVCARIYYVVFRFDLYRDHFADVFKTWNGGLAIYGAVIGAVLTAVIFCRVKKISIGAMLDVGGLGLLIGQSVGRWANFVNREAFGETTDLPWRMGLTTGEVTRYVHPTFLYESLWNAAGFLLLHFVSKKHRKFDGQIFAMYIAWYGLGRFFIEGLRTDSLKLLSTDVRVSQILAILTFGAAIIFLLYGFMKRENQPDSLYVNRVAVKNNAESSAEADGEGQAGPAASDESDADAEEPVEDAEEPAEDTEERAGGAEEPAEDEEI